MSARLRRRGLELLRARLSERDQAIIGSLGQHRFLSARQIEALHFTGHATPATGAEVCRRVLARLTASRVLVRTERRIGGVRAGSASFVYALGPVGGRLLGEQTRRRVREPSPTFLSHTLAIADIRVALVRADRAGQLELSLVKTEPACWRRYTGIGGAWQTLRPDLYVVTAKGDYEHCWFIEVDRSTESLPAVVRKCASYAVYQRNGSEQQRTGTFPIVVWSAPDSARREKIERAIAADRRLPAGLFRTVEQTELVDLFTEGA